MRGLRFVRLALIFVGASISAQLEYRANFVVSLLGAILSSGGGLFGLLILTGTGSQVGGWTFAEASIVVGLFTIVQGFIGGILYPNLNKIAETVRLGTMDFTLLKPTDAQFLVSTRNVNIFPLLNVIIGFVVIGLALPGVPGVTLAGMVLGGALLCTGLAIVYAIWFMLSTTAFWFVKVENITELFNGFFRAAQFPVSVFSGWVRVFFTFIVPVAFITTVPAEAIVGRLQPRAVLLTGVIAVLLLAASRWFWLFAVRNYTSASS